MSLKKTLALSMLALIAASAAAGPIKNEQTILGGSLTRAGVGGQTPLAESQLIDLCKKGYSSAYFLYGSVQTKTISCGENRSITYKSNSWLKPAPILEDINRDLTSKSGHVFVHCNNGAHASGYVAAIALRQFCGLSADDALKYWNRTNSYGIPPGMNTIRKGIDAFEPIEGMTRSGACP